MTPREYAKASKAVRQAAAAARMNFHLQDRTLVVHKTLQHQGLPKYALCEQNGAPLYDHEDLQEVPRTFTVTCLACLTSPAQLLPGSLDLEDV
jgi:hypothetical protein